jgi:hypothetical protein
MWLFDGGGTERGVVCGGVAGDGAAWVGVDGRTGGKLQWHGAQCNAECHCWVLRLDCLGMSTAQSGITGTRSPSSIIGNRDGCFI